MLWPTRYVTFAGYSDELLMPAKRHAAHASGCYLAELIEVPIAFIEEEIP